MNSNLELFKKVAIVTVKRDSCHKASQSPSEKDGATMFTPGRRQSKTLKLAIDERI